MLLFAKSTASVEISHQAHPCSTFLPCAISLRIPGNICIRSIPPQPAATYPRRPLLLLVAAYLASTRITTATADKPDAPLASPTTETGTPKSKWSPSDKVTNFRRYAIEAAVHTTTIPLRRQAKAGTTGRTANDLARRRHYPSCKTHQPSPLAPSRGLVISPVDYQNPRAFSKLDLLRSLPKLSIPRGAISMESALQLRCGSQYQTLLREQ